MNSEQFIFWLKGVLDSLDKEDFTQLCELIEQNLTLLINEKYNKKKYDVEDY